MAIVRVDFSTDQPPEFAPTISRIINDCMQQVLGVPPTENYIVCQAYPVEAILHAPGNCPTERLGKIAFIQITLNQGRSTELKRTFFKQLGSELQASAYLKAEDVFINFVEVASENWSFGNSNT